MVFEFFANAIPESTLIAGKVINETCILNAIRFMQENQKTWHRDVLDNIFRILQIFSELNLNAHDLKVFSEIGSIGLVSKDEEFQMLSLKILFQIVTMHPEKIDDLDPKLFVIALQLMKS